MKVESDGKDGWFVHWEAGTYFHVTVDWCDEIYRYQIKPYKSQNPVLNSLRYKLINKTATRQDVESLFPRAYQQVIIRRSDSSSVADVALRNWMKERRAKNS